MREVYSRALMMDGQHARAVEEANRALRDAAAAFGPDSPVEGKIAANMVPAQRRLGQIRAALDNATRGLGIVERHVQRDSRTRGVYLTGRGVTWLAARRAAPALNDLSEASDVLTRTLGATSPEALTARMNRVLALAYAGRLTEAEAETGPLVAAYRTHMPRHLGYAHHLQGIVERLAGRPEAALAAQQRALDAAPRDAGDDWQRMRVLPEVGLALLELGRHRDAVASFDEAIALMQKKQTDVSPARAEAWLGMGRALLALSRAEEALGPLQQADAFWRGFDAENRWGGEAAFWLARCLEAVGRHDEAREVDVRAARLLRGSAFAADAELLRVAERGR